MYRSVIALIQIVVLNSTTAENHLFPENAHVCPAKETATLVVKIPVYVTMILIVVNSIHALGHVKVD